MKIEEAKKDIMSLPILNGDRLVFSEPAMETALNIIDQIETDQPKQVVPQCAIDWVDDSRERDYEFDEWFDPDNQPLEVYKWLNCKNKRQADINALALVTLIVNGPSAVTVEKEKLYTVEIPNPNSAGGKTVLFKQKSTNSLIMAMLDENINKPERLWLTEQEIRKDFDWAFRWAKDVTE